MKKYIIYTVIFLLLNSSFLCANDIRPPEIVQTMVMGAGPTLADSVNECYQRIYNSAMHVVSVSNRNSQNTGSGWVTTIDVKYRIVR